MKRFLIVGANFMNKGAQSMLFITTDELKKYYKNCDVYFGTNNEFYDEKKYTFKRLRYTVYTQRFALLEKFPMFPVLWRSLKDWLKIIGRRILLHDKRKFEGYLELRKLMPKLDAIIDVSGYALADFSSEVEHEYYLNTIRLGKRYNVPVVLMPQSFGPFNYGEKNAYLRIQIEKLIHYPILIYAREAEGRKQLEKNFPSSNVKESADLVLQNSGIDLRNIYTAEHKATLPDLKCEKNVAVIPNFHCFTLGNEKRIIDLYLEIIKTLTKLGYNVYIFRHSVQDLEVCQKIAESFIKNAQVQLLTREFDCVEFDSFVRKFSFVVCSRYHGCVHALRNNVPCVILGWAVKYQDLAKMVEQNDYIFDITNKEVQAHTIVRAVCAMNANLTLEKEKIRERVQKIQQDNCFREVFELLDNTKSF